MAGPGARALRAQCRPGPSSNEARLLAFYSAPIAFSPAVAPELAPPGTAELGGELVPVPSPDGAIARTTVCFRANQQNTRLAPLFGRVRLALVLPAALRLELSAVPPITLWNAQPLLASMALSRTQRVGTLARGIALAMVRVHATVGRVRGPITCPTSSLQQDDPSGPCYGRAPSRDIFRPNMLGAEISLARWSPGRRMGVYAGGGISWLRPRFQVGFADDNGFVDGTRVEVNLTRAALFGGATFRVSDRVVVGGEVYAVPADATTARLIAAYRLR